jgi:hypothetical protein
LPDGFEFGGPNIGGYTPSAGGGGFSGGSGGPGKAGRSNNRRAGPRDERGTSNNKPTTGNTNSQNIPVYTLVLGIEIRKIQYEYQYVDGNRKSFWSDNNPSHQSELESMLYDNLLEPSYPPYSSPTGNSREVGELGVMRYFHFSFNKNDEAVFFPKGGDNNSLNGSNTADQEYYPTGGNDENVGRIQLDYKNLGNVDNDPQVQTGIATINFTDSESKVDLGTFGLGVGFVSYEHGFEIKRGGNMVSFRIIASQRLNAKISQTVGNESGPYTKSIFSFQGTDYVIETYQKVLGFPLWSDLPIGPQMKKKK